MIRELRKLFNITGMLRRFIILTLLRCPFDALYTAVQALFLKHAFDAVNNAQTKQSVHHLHPVRCWKHYSVLI